MRRPAGARTAVFMDAHDTMKPFIQKIRHRLAEISDSFDDLMDDVKGRFQNEDEHHVIFRALPDPRPLTMSLGDVLQKRRSCRTFNDEPLSDQDLSTLLWAADGVNRSNGRRTTPSTLDWREIDIYVLKANGIWHWVPDKQGLIFCRLEDIRSETIFAEPTLHLAPVHLVFVANRARTESLLSRLGKRILNKVRHTVWTPEHLEEVLTRSMTIDAGVKVQAVYMAATALDIGCVARTGFDRTRVEQLLRLPPSDHVICITTLGYHLSSPSELA